MFFLQTGSNGFLVGNARLSLKLFVLHLLEVLFFFEFCIFDRLKLFIRLCRLENNLTPSFKLLEATETNLNNVTFCSAWCILFLNLQKVVPILSFTLKYRSFAQIQHKFSADISFLVLVLEESSFNLSVTSNPARLTHQENEALNRLTLYSRLSSPALHLSYSISLPLTRQIIHQSLWKLA